MPFDLDAIRRNRAVLFGDIIGFCGAGLGAAIGFWLDGSAGPWLGGAIGFFVGAVLGVWIPNVVGWLDGHDA
jgi:hypothetical protein